MRNLKTVNYDEMFTLSAPSPKWVWDKQGRLVEVPAGQPAYDHDPVTGEPPGQRIEAVEDTNGHTNGELNIAITNYTLVDANDVYMPAAKVITALAGATDTPLGTLYPFGAGGGVNKALRVIYAKEGGTRYINMSRPDDAFGILFDFDQGAIISSDGADDARARRLSGGWWELSYFRAWGGASSNQYNIQFGNERVTGSDFDLVTNEGDQITIAYPSMLDTNNPEPPNPIPTDGAAVVRSADILDADTVVGGVERGSILVRCQLTEGAPVLAFDGTALVTAPDADWHTYVISYDGTETLISIDGADTTTGAGITPSLPLNVFRDSSSAGSGYIEDLVFSPIKKTAAQVKAASAAGEL